MTITSTSALTAMNNVQGGSATPKSTGEASLGQQDFLTLMTAQLRNQDPLSPMENAEFLAQMAQFSTVAGIDRVNETLSSMGSGMRDFRIATAATLLGQSVLVPGAVTRADDKGAIHGAVDLPESATSVVVTYSDAQTGNLLHSQSLGAQSQGLVGFSWEDMPSELVQARTPVRVSVSATTAAGTADIGPSVYARVISAQTTPGSTDLTLNVEDFGALSALEVESFR